MQYQKLVHLLDLPPYAALLALLGFFFLIVLFFPVHVVLLLKASVGALLRLIIVVVLVLLFIIALLPQLLQAHRCELLIDHLMDLGLRWSNRRGVRLTLRKMQLIDLVVASKDVVYETFHEVSIRGCQVLEVA